MESITIATALPTVGRHTDPDEAHDLATQMCEKSRALATERTETINNSRHRHPVLALILIIAQLVGINNIVTEEVDGVMFFNVQATTTDRDVVNKGLATNPGKGVKVRALGVGLDGSPGTGGAVEDDEEALWLQRKQDGVMNHSIPIYDAVCHLHGGDLHPLL